MDVVFEVIGQLESFQISREELEVKSSNRCVKFWVPVFSRSYPIFMQS